MFTLNKFKIGILTTAFVTLASSAYASSLKVTNNDTAEVEVIIEQGAGTMLKSGNYIKRTIKAGGTENIVVTKEQLGSSDTFVVKGTVKMPSTDNKCGPLSIEKDYNITFSAGSVGGTVCKFENVTTDNSTN